MNPFKNRKETPRQPSPRYDKFPDGGSGIMPGFDQQRAELDRKMQLSFRILTALSIGCIVAAGIGAVILISLINN